jgi:hypothetical protein
MIEEGLRRVLADDATGAEPVSLPVYGDAGGRFLVDLTDRDALWTALDAGNAR